MNMARIGLAALAGFIAYFVLGGIMAAPAAVRNEFAKYPAIYRSPETIKHVLPYGILAMFIAMLALAAIYARFYNGGSGLAEGARFGALVGVFAVGSFVVHNYVNLNIGVKITLEQSLAYMVEWIVVGMVMGLIYKPSR